MLRLELVTWNPLDENNIDLERMEWYEVLIKYGYDSNETETSVLEDPDIRLIPTLIEKIVLPKLTGLPHSAARAHGRFV